MCNGWPPRWASSWNSSSKSPEGGSSRQEQLVRQLRRRHLSPQRPWLGMLATHRLLADLLPARLGPSLGLAGQPVQEPLDLDAVVLDPLAVQIRRQMDRRADHRPGPRKGPRDRKPVPTAGPPGTIVAHA